MFRVAIPSSLLLVLIPGHAAASGWTNFRDAVTAPVRVPIEKGEDFLKKPTVKNAVKVIFSQQIAAKDSVDNAIDAINEVVESNPDLKKTVEGKQIAVSIPTDSGPATTPSPPPDISSSPTADPQGPPASGSIFTATLSELNGSNAVVFITPLPTQLTALNRPSTTSSSGLPTVPQTEEVIAIERSPAMAKNRVIADKVVRTQITKKIERSLCVVEVVTSYLKSQHLECTERFQFCGDPVFGTGCVDAGCNKWVWIDDREWMNNPQEYILSCGSDILNAPDAH
ncbi:hypothetical protein KYC5002_02780 [Archangium violaceum]|uniref:hypothetical protein n=1 Tax=Archangium violaceum TaxID=83451 RepID=UPI002B2ADFBC|nr:hypothetical protein KYC5002_02780 [Archangium gephyra]